MHTRQLRTFVVAASTLNFTRTAEAVNLAPSSVSEQIQALELELGTALFDRSRRELQLTPAGTLFLDYARELVALTDEARAAAADTGGTGRGTIEVGALESLAALWLPSLLARFRLDHPAVSVNLRVGNSKALRNAVLSGELDVCLAFGAGGADPNLLHRIAGDSPMVAVLRVDHPLSGLTSLTLANFSDEAFIVTGHDCIYRQVFDQAFVINTLRQPEIASEVGSIAAISRMVAAGMGCAILPRIAVVEESGVVLLPISDLATLPITMTWRQRRVQRPALQRFLAEAFPEEPSSDQAVSAIDMQHRPRHESIA